MMRDHLAAKLDAYRASIQGKKVDFATFDCVRWTGGWVSIATGADKLQGLEWSSLAEGAELLARMDVTDLAGAVSKLLRPIPVAQAMLGDILAMAAPTGSPWNPLGICCGLNAEFLFEKTPLMRTRTMRAAHAWSLN